MSESVTTLTELQESSSHESELLEIIHSDIIKIEVNSIGGSWYACTFIGELSRLTFAYILKNKYELFIKLKDFDKMVEKQTGKCLKILRRDDDGEYMSKIFVQFSEALESALSAAHFRAEWGI